MNPEKEKLFNAVQAIAGDLDEISRFLYEHPETAYQEHNSCRWLCEFLEKRSFKVQAPAGGLETAFFAVPKNAYPARPRIAFLAEYDALEKIGHGCGHNMIAAMSLGAAMAIQQTFPECSGSFVIVGTPAEEGGGGKARLAESGIFEGIDAAMMTHPGQANLAGEDTLGRIKAKIEFFGRTAHAAAAPEVGLNALDALVGAYTNVGLLRQQMSDDARIHGIITHGGDAPNVVPDYTAALFYVRAATLPVLEKLFGRFQDCCHGAALAAGCRCEVNVEPPSLDPMKRNKTLERLWLNNAERLGLDVTQKVGPSGSTDLGNLSRIMPVVQPFVAICDRDIALHSIGFADATRTERGRKAMLAGATALALTAFDYLRAPEAQRAAQVEFQGG